MSQLNTRVPPVSRAVADIASHLIVVEGRAERENDLNAKRQGLMFGFDCSYVGPAWTCTIASSPALTEWLVRVERQATVTSVCNSIALIRVFSIVVLIAFRLLISGTDRPVSRFYFFAASRCGFDPHRLRLVLT